MWMYEKMEAPPCAWESCFAYDEKKEDHCRVLIRNGGTPQRPCPFYKTKEQYQQDQEKYMKK